MPKDNKKNESDIKTVKVQKAPSGSSGTEIFSGDFAEEYLNQLHGTRRADIFDRIRRSDARVKMVVSAVKNPIRSASWEWEANGDGPDAQLHADFLSHVFFKDFKRKTWSQTLNESLSVVEFGHSIFEVAHKLVQGDEQFGEYIGLESLGWRSPKTIEDWILDTKSGQLTGIRQQSQGDLGNDIVIDADYLYTMSIEQEGDLYEGVSMLRPCFGAWKRKDVYLKLMAIGIEKDAVSTPIATVPAGKAGSDEFDNLVAALMAYTSHQCGYLTVPEGWDIKIESNNFDASKMREALEFENQEITFAFLANFLGLGSTGGGGSYSLSNDLSDFFLGGIKYVAGTIGETWEKLGRDLIILNFGPQASYPELKAHGISDKAGKEFGELMSKMGQSGFIIPDDGIEENLRRRIGLPKIQEDSRRPQNAKPGEGDTGKDGGNPPDDGKGGPDDGGPPKGEKDAGGDDGDGVEDDAKLSNIPGSTQLTVASARTTIKRGSASVHADIQTNLTKILNDILKRMSQRYKAASDADIILIPNQIAREGHKGLTAFKKDISRSLDISANMAIDDAMREVKADSDLDIRLGATFMGVKLAKEKKLPKNLSNRVKSQADLLAETTLADMEKIAYFSFGDSVVSTDDLKIILNDVRQSSEKFIDGASLATASTNAASRVVNESRNAVFFDPDIAETIESMTFTNPDPKSPICKDLTGKTFNADDPEAARYYPPLHHNCKSVLVTNLKSGRKNPEMTDGGLRPSNSKLEKFITLTKEKETSLL